MQSHEFDVDLLNRIFKPLGDGNMKSSQYICNIYIMNTFNYYNDLTAGITKFYHRRNRDKNRELWWHTVVHTTL